MSLNDVRRERLQLLLTNVYIVIIDKLDNTALNRVL